MPGPSKKSIPVLILLLAVIILVIIKAFSLSGFRTDAISYGMPAIERTNIITEEKISSLEGDILVINLDDKVPDHNYRNARVIRISPDSLLHRRNIAYLRKHHSPVVLYSANAGKQAAAWMILSQTGLKDVYILSPDNKEEILKYEFRPDSLIKPEF